MAKVSQLTLIFRDKLQTTNHTNSDAVEKKPLAPHHRDQLSREVASWPSFQMPLHYPSFTKEEYEAMSEEELDRLLRLYGLPTNLGDLSCKKQFVIGAFLWEKGIDSSPDTHEVNPSSSIGDFSENSLMTALKYMVHYVFRV